MCLGDLGQPEEADDDHYQPDGHDAADRDLVAERAGDRHGQHRADALRRHQQAGRQGRLAADLLEVGGHEQQAAEERRHEQEHRDDGDREVAVLEQPQVDQRVLGPERVEDERDHQGQAQDRGHPHAAVGVVAVGGAGDRRDAVEEQRQPGRHQRHAEEVEGLRGLGRVLVEDEPGVDDRCEAERHVDQEDPVPAGVLDQPAAEDRAHDRAEQHRARRGSPSGGPSDAGPPPGS